MLDARTVRVYIPYMHAQRQSCLTVEVELMNDSGERVTVTASGATVDDAIENSIAALTPGDEYNEPGWAMDAWMAV